ncbi:MAG: Bacterial export protein family 3 [Myxococcaceae bacterium]|nr:Bacterial export protein family 3 [Myxococcaceae bacterium]
MNEAFAQALAAFELALRLSLPLLGAAFAVGLLFALLSALTRVGEPALSALPRAAVTLLVLGGAGGWMARELVAYSAQLFRALPYLVR